MKITASHFPVKVNYKQPLGDYWESDESREGNPFDSEVVQPGFEFTIPEGSKVVSVYEITPLPEGAKDPQTPTGLVGD